jgi:hypothetical protein
MPFCLCVAGPIVSTSRSHHLSDSDWLLLETLDTRCQRPLHTGRFLTMHKRRRKRLTTRSLTQEPGLLDDIHHGQVQVQLARSHRDTTSFGLLDNGSYIQYSYIQYSTVTYSTVTVTYSTVTYSTVTVTYSTVTYSVWLPIHCLCVWLPIHCLGVWLPIHCLGVWLPRHSETMNRSYHFPSDTNT